MEERQFVLSVKKIVANCKKFFWICLLTTLAGIGAFAYLHKDSVEKAKNSTGGELFQAEAFIYVDNDEKNYYSTYAMAAADIAILEENADILTEINRQLVEQGYAKLNNKDFINSLMLTDNLVSVEVVSTLQPERTEFIANLLADLMVELGKETFNPKELRVFSYAVAYSATSPRQNEYWRTFRTADMVRASHANPDVSVKELAVIAVGLAFGIFLIGLIVIFDKKVYTTGDVQGIPEAIYLGDANGEENIKLAAASTVRQCELREAKKVAIIGLTKTADELKELEYSKALAGLEKMYISAADLTDAKIEEIKKADVAVIYIKGGKDKFTVLDKLTWRVKTLGTDIMGFVIGK